MDTLEVIDDCMTMDIPKYLSNEQSNILLSGGYLELTSGGFKEEGKPYPALYTSKVHAVNLFYKELVDYVPKHEKVYWKKKPEMVRVSFPGDVVSRWNFYFVRAEFTLRSSI